MPLEARWAPSARNGPESPSGLPLPLHPGQRCALCSVDRGVLSLDRVELGEEGRLFGKRGRRLQRSRPPMQCRAPADVRIAFTRWLEMTPSAHAQHLVPTVAVVDDDEGLRYALRNLLASLDLAVAHFASAQEFFASPVCGAAACLIVDLRMPGMSGLELQRHLIDRGDRLPIIFITGFPDEHVQQQAEGACAFFAKPFDAGRLIECVKCAIAARAID